MAKPRSPIFFRDQYNIDIVDADVVAREVVEPDSPGLSAIIARYGEQILWQDGTLNRPALREIIFAKPEEKQWLDALLHPMIRQTMQDQLQQVQSDYALLVIPLMVENNLQQLADIVLVVDVEEEVQLERTINRDGVSREQAESILRSQATRTQRLAIANDVIKNSSQNQHLLPQVAKLHQKYLEMCRGNQ